MMMMTLLVVVDVFTGYAKLDALTDKTALEVAKALYKTFTTLGIPRVLQSDNAPEFKAELMQEFEKYALVDRRFIVPYNPRADGKVEHTIKMISQSLKKIIQGRPSDWHKYLDAVQLAHNEKISSVTGSSPFELMFGRKVRNADIIDEDDKKDSINTPKTFSSVGQMDNWKENLRLMREVIYPETAKRVEGKKETQRAKTDLNRGKLVKDTHFEKGNIVMVKDENKKDKMSPAYEGPFMIIRVDYGKYELYDKGSDSLYHRAVTKDMLKFVAASWDDWQNKEEIYEIKALLDHRVNHTGEYEFLILWQGDNKVETWEPVSNIIDVHAVRKYWKNVEAGIDIKSQYAKHRSDENLKKDRQLNSKTNTDKVISRNKKNKKVKETKQVNAEKDMVNASSNQTPGVSSRGRRILRKGAYV